MIFFPVLFLNFLVGIHIPKDRKGHKLLFLGLILLEICIIMKCIFPTCWKYPDLFIKSDIVGYRDVEQLYGSFDIESTEFPLYKAYYMYTDREGNRHYYCMWIDTEGFVVTVEDKIL